MSSELSSAKASLQAWLNLSQTAASLILALGLAASPVTARSAQAPLSVPPSSAVQPAPFTNAELVLGSKFAPVTVIEYLSDTCTHCAAFDADTFDAVQSRYIDQGLVKYVVREMPTAPVAVSAAGFLLARCAGQDRYWPLIRRFLQQVSFVLAGMDAPERISRLEQVSGTSSADAERCLSDTSALEAMNARRDDGLNAGVQGTPTFIFDGRMLQAGDRLAGTTYLGGELSQAQFAAAYKVALRSSKRTQLGPAHPPSASRQ